MEKGRYSGGEVLKRGSCVLSVRSLHYHVLPRYVLGMYSAFSSLHASEASLNLRFSVSGGTE